MRLSLRYGITGVVLLSLLCPGCATAKRHTHQVTVEKDTIVIPEEIFLTEYIEEAEHDAACHTSAPIAGYPAVDAETMWRFVARRNPEFDREIAEAFHRVGIKYGIRGDIALCQSILETGWFRFGGGTAVRPDQHNYCGLGVVRKGVKGASFATVEEGVTAQIQHLYAYATVAPLPKGEKLIDPRFDKVRRGIAQTWADLNNRWAMNSHYAEKIMALYAEMLELAE